MSQYFDLKFHDALEPEAVSGKWSLVAQLDAIEASATGMLHILAQPPGSASSRAHKPGKGCGARIRRPDAALQLSEAMTDGRAALYVASQQEHLEMARGFCDGVAWKNQAITGG